MKPIQLFAIIFLTLVSCTSVVQQEPSLKNTFETDFLIGTAVGNEHLDRSNPKADQLISKEFAVITPENVMKSEVIHPEWDRYYFTMSDKVIALGEANRIPVVGHTLVWHGQLSPFIEENISPDSLQLFMQNHISKVAGRYDGKLLGWDVINEALNEDGTLRNSIFLQKLGEQYLIDAFKYAHEASPASELYYND